MEGNTAKQLRTQLILAEDRIRTLENSPKAPLELDYDQLARSLCLKEGLTSSLLAHSYEPSKSTLLPADFLVSSTQAFASTMASALEEVLIG